MHVYIHYNICYCIDRDYSKRLQYDPNTIAYINVYFEYTGILSGWIRKCIGNGIKSLYKAYMSPQGNIRMGIL